VQEFALRLECNIFSLQDELRSGSYQHGQYASFRVHDPKLRLINKATVRDRVVHQLLTNFSEPMFDKSFIFDSFSCRKDKGTHASVSRLTHFLREASKNNTRTVYALKCDVRKFFDSVDHYALRGLLSLKIKDKRVLWLVDGVLDSFCTLPGKGLPLGSLTSQLWANVYMNEFDKFVKHELKEKYYLRYCDDFVILATDMRHLTNVLSQCKSFLNAELMLDIHPTKTSIMTWHQGIDFVGYVQKPDVVLLRKSTASRALKNADLTNISSYLGVCTNGNCHELSNQIKNRVGYLKE
jgi:RNA-directed DNA polymerase